MLLVLLYGLLKGSREIAKKKAMAKNSVMEVLVVYTVLSFIFVIPQAPNAMGLEPKYYGFIAIKSFAIFLAWICSFRSLKKLPVSLYGILDLSRVLFATFFGVVILAERPSIWQISGLVIVSLGLLLLKFKPPFLARIFKIDDKNKGTDGKSFQGTVPSVKTDSKIDSVPSVPSQPLPQKDHSLTFYVILALISCMLNAVSGFLDKVLMTDMTSAQLQFWYMLFLVIYYVLYVIFTKEKIRMSVLKNGWVWLLAVMFVIGDKALFIANGNPNSKITIMTLIKQSGCIVTILGGKFIFKEKNTGYRFFCAVIVILGIVMGVVRA